jgi:hypothetical protein
LNKIFLGLVVCTIIGYVCVHLIYDILLKTQEQK